jgi:hypothetical protein
LEWGDQGVVHIYADETGNRQPAKTRGGEKGAPRDPGLLLLADPTRTHITSHQNTFTIKNMAAQKKKEMRSSFFFFFFISDKKRRIASGDPIASSSSS